MDLALSDLQALTLVVTCAAVALVAIAVPVRWSAVVAITAEVVFALWTRSMAGALSSGALLGLALCVGSIVRLRRARSLAAEATLREAVAASEARREAAVLEERAFLAREIHDVLAHSLSALAIQLERVRLEVGALPGGEHAADELARAHQLAANGMDEVRGAIGALRGDRSVGFDEMARLADEFQASTGIVTTFVERGDHDVDLPAGASVLLFRALQEALTNAARHASPTRVDAELSCAPDAVVLRVTNDGAGTRPASTRSGGYGLQGLRERVALVGGTVDAAPVDGNRFEVVVGLPR